MVLIGVVGRDWAKSTDDTIDLHICFTAPDVRRRGIGSLMMQWGCDLADLLFLSTWIEASPEGNYLYQRFGFYELEKLYHAGEVMGTCMRRDTKPWWVGGGG